MSDIHPIHAEDALIQPPPGQTPLFRLFMVMMMMMVMMVVMMVVTVAIVVMMMVVVVVMHLLLRTGCTCQRQHHEGCRHDGSSQEFLKHFNLLFSPQRGNKRPRSHIRLPVRRMNEGRGLKLI
jgi:hypothetical protein